MGCPGEAVIGDNLVFSVSTHDPDTGVLTDADSVPTYRIYEDETATPILTGNMAKLDDGNTTGFYTELIAVTAANGFEDGKSYTIYIEATVDSDKGGIVYSFKAVDPLLWRVYWILNNKMVVTDSTGVITLRNTTDTANLATSKAEDDLTSTVRSIFTWV